MMERAEGFWRVRLGCDQWEIAEVHKPAGRTMVRWLGTDDGSPLAHADANEVSEWGPYLGREPGWLGKMTEPLRGHIVERCDSVAHLDDTLAEDVAEMFDILGHTGEYSGEGSDTSGGARDAVEVAKPKPRTCGACQQPCPNCVCPKGYYEGMCGSSH